MEVSIKDGFITLRAPVAKNPEPSKSGKTLILFSSHGLVTTTAKVGSSSVIVGFNAMVKPSI
jgi:hypothetical protein